MTAAPTPLVSVVTIFWNAPIGFFEEAIASVLAQTYPHWELLLADDGSTDASVEVARRAAAEHPDRIRVLAHPGGAHRGMSATRNLGIRAARGELLAFLDADDVYLPEKLESQVRTLQQHPEAAVVFGPTVHWWSWSGDPADLSRDHARRLGAHPETLVPPPELVRSYLAREADTPATCGVLVRRTAVQQVGDFEVSFPDLYEDQAFFFKLLLASPAYVEGRAWDRYRRHPEALCEVRIRSGEHADDYSATAPRRIFLEWLEGYFDKVAVTDVGLRRLLEGELSPYRHPMRHRLALGLRGAARSTLPARVRRTGRRALGPRQETSREART